jgi:hypothetical protein
MAMTFPVLWTFNNELSTGRLDVEDDRLTLTSRTHAFSIPRSAILHQTVERGPGKRIRGLPALTLDLRGGQVRLASLGGAGSLQEIAQLVSASQAEEPGPRLSSLTPATTR